MSFKTIITCPECGHKSEHIAHTDRCEIIYECPKCKAKLKPNKEDCCISCSHGSEQKCEDED